jgi:hypothetical protein
MGHLLPAVSGECENRGCSQHAFVSSALDPTPAQQCSLFSQDVSDVASALRRALASGTQPPASIIHAAVEFARILTGAHGVALGVRIKGAMVCRARSGDLAPELGSALNADAGISGQCLRSGVTLVCDDAESDERVDHDACRALGVRSILAVPLHGNIGIVGLLEAFSGRPAAFTDDQIDALQALTDIIEIAHAREINPHESRERERAAIRVATRRELFVKHAMQGNTPRTLFLAIPKAIGEDKLSHKVLGEPALTRHFWIAAIATAALLLGSLGVWLSLREPIPEAAGAEPAAAVAPQSPATKSEIRHTTFLKPDAGTILQKRVHKATVAHKPGKMVQQTTLNFDTASAKP